MKRLIIALGLLLASYAPAFAQHTVLCANDPTCVTTTLTGGGDVVAAGNNAFTGTNSFANLTTFNLDPLIKGNGTATDGAAFFGTNLGTRFIAYDATTGGTGGYSLGSTFGVSDTLYVGPVQVSNGASHHVILKSPIGSVNWTMTLPVNAGTTGYLLSTDGSGNTSWIAGSGSGTVTNIATSTGLTGGPITSTGTITCNTLSSSTIGCGKVDNTSLTASAGTMSLAAPTANSRGLAFVLGGGYMFESGGVALSGGTSGPLNFPVAFPTGISGVTATALTSGSCVITYTDTLSTVTFYGGAGCGGSETVTWTAVGH